jgi:hypothetical protein
MKGEKAKPAPSSSKSIFEWLGIVLNDVRKCFSDGPGSRQIAVGKSRLLAEFQRS